MKDYSVLLKDKGLKITSARTAILDLLSNKHLPLDVEEIATYLETNKIEVNKATIYRILEIFVKENIVRPIELREGKLRYEIASAPHHHHAVCTNCGKIQDIEDCNIENLENKIKSKMKFKAESHNIEIFGLCSSCN